MTIIQGGLGGAGKHTDYMIRHLTRTDQNDHVEVLEMDQIFPDRTIESALQDWQILTYMTKSAKSFYEASINPKQDEVLTKEQWIKAADILEQTMGFTGQPRFIVLHRKNHREHVHVLWQSVIVDQEKILSDSHNYRNHERAQIAIEEALGLSPSPRRFFSDEVHETVIDNSAYSRKEQKQAERSGIQPPERKELITRLYQDSQDWHQFNKAIETEGYYLARGDKSNIFVIVDPGQEVHALKSCIPKSIASTREIKAFLSPITPSGLAKASEVIQALKHPEHANQDAERIEADYEERNALEKSLYQSALDHLNTLHQLKDEAVKRSRISKRKSNTRLFIRHVLGINILQSWIYAREDRLRNNEQRIERDRLGFEYKNKCTKLEREKRRALSNLDEVHRINAGAWPRFMVSDDQAKFNQVISCLDRLAQYDQDDGYFVWQEKAYREQMKIKANYELRQIRFEKLRAYVAARFALVFKDDDAALSKFEQLVEQDGLRRARKLLKMQPEYFGDMHHFKPQALQSCLDQYNQLVKQQGWLDGNQDEYLFAKHMCERFPHRKLENITGPDDTRLALMSELWQAAKNLNDELWNSLNANQQREITLARLAFGSKAATQRSSEALKPQDIGNPSRNHD